MALLGTRLEGLYVKPFDKNQVPIGSGALRPNSTYTWATELHVSTTAVAAHTQMCVLLILEPKSDREKPMPRISWFYLIQLYVELRPVEMKWHFIWTALNEHMSHNGTRTSGKRMNCSLLLFLLIPNI